jgi:hypothetical protein
LDDDYFNRQPEAILLNKSLIDALNQAAKNSDTDVKMTITEAFPPGTIHEDLKHYNGMAVDISYLKGAFSYIAEYTYPPKIADPEKFSDFIVKLLQSNNVGTILFEYEISNKDSLYDCLKKAVKDEKRGNIDKKGTIITLNDIKDNLGEDFCEKQCTSTETECYFLGRFLYNLRKKSNDNRIKFASYSTTQGNPLHIER